MSEVTEITTEVDFNNHISSLPPSTLLILSFYAPWAAPCAQMNQVLKTLAQSYPSTSPPSTSWISVNAEDLPDVSEEYDVSAVPYLVLIRDKNVLETVSGSDAIKVRSAIEKHAKSSVKGKQYGDGEPLAELERSTPATQVKPATRAENGLDSTSNTTTPQAAATPSNSAIDKDDDNAQSEDLHTRLTNLVKAANVMLFMKGTPSAPQCGFSRQLVALLREHSVRYGFFNILADDEVRQGLKEFADWPTFPQLWVDGELVGGLDIVKEEIENDPEFLKDYSVRAAA